MAGKIAVALRDDLDLVPFEFVMKRFENGLRYIDCESVTTHESGFLKLVPLNKSTGSQSTPAIYFPTSYVVWMIQAETPDLPAEPQD